MVINSGVRKARNGKFGTRFLRHARLDSSDQMNHGGFVIGCKLSLFKTFHLPSNNNLRYPQQRKCLHYVVYQLGQGGNPYAHSVYVSIALLPDHCHSFAQTPLDLLRTLNSYSNLTPHFHFFPPGILLQSLQRMS
jgi:hypothetical protein